MTSDDRDAVVAIVIALQGLVVWMTVVIVVRESVRLKCVALGYTIAVVGLLANFHELFQKTHDVWLNLLVVDLMWIITATMVCCEPICFFRCG